MADIQYYNAKTKGSSGEYGEVEFNEENKKVVDKYLEPVFETGWSSKDIFLFGDHYKSISFDRPNFKGNKSRHWSTNYGCLFFLLFPLFAIIELLIKARILGTIELVEIEPFKMK